MPESRILALNCGSSSLKFGVYEAEQLLIEGEAEEIGRDGAKFWTRERQGPKQESVQSIGDHAVAFDLALSALSAPERLALNAVGHRVVHGGPKLRNHVQLNEAAIRELRNAIPFAPLHVPTSLVVIDAVSKTMPNLPQVICLDTAFHKDLPDLVRTLAFSRDVRDKGVERYGFHGLSVESIVEQFEVIPLRMVVAHLGNGSSITALREGKSIDTTMGLTPSGGVMMGTRSGDVDPGVLMFLMRQGVKSDELESLVDHEAGLKGVSEKSSDVRELSEARQADARSDLALRMFAYQVKKAIAGMAAALSGLDTLVFTGGIGEHAKAVREDICRGLSVLGDFETRVMPSQEDLQIARITRRVLAKRAVA